MLAKSVNSLLSWFSLKMTNAECSTLTFFCLRSFIICGCFMVGFFVVVLWLDSLINGY